VLDVQTYIWLLSVMATPFVFAYGMFLGLWFMGLPPFHKSPVIETPIPIAVCPNCGYRSREFLAFVQKLQSAEHGDSGGQSDNV